jgi:hypothetical protein
MATNATFPARADVHAGRSEVVWTLISTEYVPLSGRVYAAELEWLEPHAANVTLTNPPVTATRGKTRFIDASCWLPPCG